MKQCSHCHAEIPDQSQFCPECGQRQIPDSDQTAASLCPVCREPIVPGSRFCGSCGHPFPAEVPAEQQESAAADDAAAGPEPAAESTGEPVSAADESVTINEDQVDENYSEPGDEPPENVAADEPQEDESEIGPFPSAIAAPPLESADVDTAPEALEITAKQETAAPAGPAFCPGCGYKLSPNAQFCPSCGRKTRREPSAQGPAGVVIPPPVAAQARPASGGWVPPSTAQPVPQQRSYAPPPQNGGWTPPPSYGPGIPPPRKKKKGPLIALIIILVLALAAAGAYALFGREIRRLILGNKATYLRIEAIQLKEDASEMARQMTELGSRAEAPPAGGHDFSLSLDWPDNMSGMDPVMQATLESLDIQGRLLYDRVGTSPRYFAAIDLLTGTEPLLTLEGYYDPERLILGLPGIISRYVMIPREMMDDYSAQMGIDPQDTGEALGLADSLLNFDLGVSELQLAGSLHAYIDIMLDHIDSVTYDKGQTLEVGSVSQKYDRFTMTIGDENARKMIEQILLTLRDDEIMFRMVSEIGKMSAGLNSGMLDDDEFGEVVVPEMTLAEWQQTIDVLLAEIEAEDPDREPFTIVQSIYVDPSDRVYGRDFQIVDDSGLTVLQIEQYQPEKDDDGAVLLRLDSEGDGITYQNLFTWDENRETRSGTITISDSESTLMDINYSGYEQARIGSRTYILGDFDLTLHDDEPVALRYQASRDGERVTMNIGIQDLMDMRLGYQEINAAEVTFPTFSTDQLVSISDSEGLAGLIDENAMTELMRIAQQLGLMPSGEGE